MSPPAGPASVPHYVSVLSPSGAASDVLDPADKEPLELFVWNWLARIGAIRACASYSATVRRVLLSCWALLCYFYPSPRPMCPAPFTDGGTGVDDYLIFRPGRPLAWAKPMRCD